MYEDRRGLFSLNEIEELKDCIVEQLLPIQIYLFGSYANITFTNENDLDFYIVVKDDVADISTETTRAYKAIRRVKQCPVDIVLGTRSRFEARKEIPSVEKYIERGCFYMTPETKEWYDMAVMDLGVAKHLDKILRWVHKIVSGDE